MKKGSKQFELDHVKEDFVMSGKKKVDERNERNVNQQVANDDNLVSVEFTSTYVNVLFVSVNVFFFGFSLSVC